MNKTTQCNEYQVKEQREISPTKNGKMFGEKSCLSWNTSEMPSAKRFTITSTESMQTLQSEDKCDLNVMFSKGDEVEDYLESLVMQNSRLALIRDHKILMRSDHKDMEDKVKILSGGMSGLEPWHSGFVGSGMLTAAVLGKVASSPTHMSVLAALRLLSKDHEPGVLVIVMNNLADRLNFSMACQLATREGIRAICLVVGEDCSGLAVNKSIGRRGLAGVLLLQKIAGAMSEEKKNLYEMHCVLTALKGKCLGTINVGIVRDGIDIGLGLKGETGKLVCVNSIPVIVNEALFYLLHPGSYFSLQVEKHDEVALLINNFGKLSDLQFSLTLREILKRLISLGLKPVRVISGRFLTIKDTAGFSVSVLKIKHENILKWIDANINVMIWPNRLNDTKDECAATSCKERCSDYIQHVSLGSSLFLSDVDDEILEKNIGPRFTVKNAAMAVRVLNLIIESLSKMEHYLNYCDHDHEYGSKVKVYMQKIGEAMQKKTLNILTPYGLLNELAELAAVHMGGASGAVWSVMLCSAAQAFLSSSRCKCVDWEMWQEAAKRAKEGLCAYTRVQLGHCTVLDSLGHFTDTFTETTMACFSKAVCAAVQGAETTELLRSHRDSGPDPGAYTVAVILRLILSELSVDLQLTDTDEELSFCESCLEIMVEEQAHHVDTWFCDLCFVELNN